MAEIVSKRYAKALFDICIEDNSIDKVQEDALQIVNLYNEEEDFKTIMSHPNLSSEDKFNLLKKSFGDNMDKTLYGFFHVVLTKNRETYIYDILTSFLEYVDEYKGVTVATVTTAKQLTDEQIEKIKSKLSIKLNKKVNVDVVLDQSLIGGLVINVDGLLIDSSIKSSINNLTKTLLNA